MEGKNERPLSLKKHQNFEIVANSTPINWADQSTLQFAGITFNESDGKKGSLKICNSSLTA